MMPSRPAILWTLVCVVCGSSAFEMTGLLSRRCQVGTCVIRRAAKTNVDNPYPLLEKAVDMAPQFKLGRRVKYGLFSDEVTASDIDESASAQRERAELRRKAAASLTNIDDTERERRRTVGTGLSIVSLVVAGVLINSNAGPLARFGIFPLDVDGTGLQQITDAQIARQILDKVNALNLRSVAVATALSLSFAATYYVQAALLE